jgi:ribonuclease P protein component
VLSREHRLTDPDTFRVVVRRGRRAGGRLVVVHFDEAPETGAAEGGPRVGFVVSKAVGPAVVRNRVKRRLRHLARESLMGLPGSAVLVVRALPAAASASYEELGADLARCLQRVLSS